MPRQQVIIITDDLTGKNITEAEALDVTVVLVVKHGDEEMERTAWELCLAEASKNKLADALKPFTEKVPEVAPPVTTGGGKPKAASARNAHIRAWWGNLTSGQRVDMGGLPEVSSKGRVPEAVQSKYDELKPEGYVSANE